MFCWDQMTSLGGLLLFLYLFGYFSFYPKCIRVSNEMSAKSRRQVMDLPDQDDQLIDGFYIIQRWLDSASASNLCFESSRRARCEMQRGIAQP